MAEAPATPGAGAAPGIDPALYRAMLRASCAYYCAEKLKGPKEAPYSGRFLVAPHHTEWSEAAAKHKKIRVLAARDLGKSFFWSLGYILWQVERQGEKADDDACGYLFSSTQPNANKLLKKIRRAVESNPKLQHLLPTDKDAEWSASALRFRNGVILYAHGAGTAVRGGHPYFIVCDDILGDRVATSPLVRAQITDYVLSTIMPMLIPGGQIVVVGTPLAEDDVYAVLEAAPEWWSGDYPAEREIDGVRVAAWPERYPLRALDVILATSGSLRYSREYLCKPRSNLSSLFPDELFMQPGIWKRYSLGLDRAVLEAQFAIIAFYIGIDYGLSATTKSDSTVIFCWGLDEHGNHWLIDIDIGVGWGYDEQRQHAERMGTKYDVALMYSEAIQAQRVFGENLKAETDLPIELFFTDVKKHSLEHGIPGMRLMFETQKIRIPYDQETAFTQRAAISTLLSAPNTSGVTMSLPEGTEYTRTTLCIALWQKQMQSFVLQDGLVVSTGKHDDVCVAPGAHVSTARGPIPIESVLPGDSVLTHRSRWRRVTGVTSRAFSGALVKVKPSGLLSFAVTEEHPIWTTTSRRDVEVNNFRILPCEDRWHFARAADLRVGPRLTSDFVFSPFAIQPSRTEHPAFDLANYIDVLPLPHGGPRWKVQADRIWWRGDRVIPRRLEIDFAMTLLIGLYLAEGSCGGRKGMRHQAAFALGPDEGFIEDFIEAQADRLFAARVCRSAHKIDRGRSIGISSVPAARFFAQLGRRSTEKQLPWSWLSWPLALRLGVVRGWLIGDGSMAETGQLRGMTTSRGLVEQVRLTLVEASLCPTVTNYRQVGRDLPGRRSTSAAPAWTVSLSASDSARLLTDMLAVEQHRWGARVGSVRTRTNSRSVPCSGGLATKLTSLARVPYEGVVYNLHVEEDESYVVEGVAVHNCMAGWIGWRASKEGRNFDFSMGEQPGDAEALAQDMREIGLDIDGRPLPRAEGEPDPFEDADDAFTGAAPSKPIPIEEVRNAVPGGSWLSLLGMR